MGTTYYGTSGADTLTDLQGDTLVGGAGDDTYIISNPNETIVENPNAGIDTVKVWCSYTLAANLENLVVQGNALTGIGNALANTITAQGFGDFISGGAGADTLLDTGTGGKNIFSFGQGSGQDVLTGFNTTSVNHDFIQLTNYGFTSFAQVQAHLTQVGSDVQLQLDASDSVLIKNVSASSLNANDFLLQTPGALGQATFDDEFNSLSLYDPTTGQGTWKTNYWFGSQSGSSDWSSRTIGNGEQVLFVDPSYKGTASSSLNLNPFSLSNGVVSLTVAKAPTADVQYLHGQQYTAGLLTTEKTFAQTYGYFEMRAQTPAGSGLWPAFWLLPTDNGVQEIDVSEQVSKGYSFSTDHTTDPNASTTTFSTLFSGQGDGQFHTYGLLWTPQYLTYYIDGVAVGQTPTPADLNKPMYLIVSMGAGGSWPGQLDPSFTSASMNVDYVRAYALPTGETDSLGPNGALTKHFAGITGQAYTAYDELHAASGALTGKVFYDATGAVIETDAYAPDGSHTAHATAAAGATYATSSSSYSAAGALVSRILYDAAGTVIETDAYAPDGSHTAHTAAPAGAAYVSSDIIYDAAGNVLSTVNHAANGAIVANPTAPAVQTPVVSAPVVSAPVVSAPAAAAPVVSVPAATLPVAAIPAAAAPVVSLPVATLPVAPTPAAAAPVVSLPVATPAVAPVPVAAATVVHALTVTAPVISVPTATVASTAPSSTDHASAASSSTAGDTQIAAPAVNPFDGGAGGLVISAAAAGSTVIGGPQDALYAGAGADTFVFKTAAASPLSGFATIVNFQHGVDMLDISAADHGGVEIFMAGPDTFVYFDPGGSLGFQSVVEVTSLLTASDLIVSPSVAATYLYADSGADTLDASAGHIIAVAGTGGDTFIAGPADQLYASQVAGALADTFVIPTLAASPYSAVGFNAIVDFRSGTDKLDISAVDGGRIMLQQSGGATFVYFHVNAQGGYDGAVEVAGPLAASDIIASHAALSQGFMIVGDANEGAGGHETLTGGVETDYLYAGPGHDTLVGGGGGDFFEGGGGADTYLYRSAQDSTVSAPDVIDNFAPGKGDLIDLSGLDAIASTAAQDHFAFVSAFDGHAGELVLQTPDASGYWHLMGDTTGAGVADFEIAFHALNGATYSDVHNHIIL